MIYGFEAPSVDTALGLLTLRRARVHHRVLLSAPTQVVCCSATAALSRWSRRRLPPAA